MGPRRARLHQLTERWRVRHDAQRAGQPRPAATEEQEARAASAFPYRQLSPRAYANRHGPDMIGFTFDDVAYADPELDAWIAELGRLLRVRRVIPGG
jgi:hypothetical protein